MASDSLPDGLLEIYKIAVEMADRVSARRALANSFFLTAEAGLLALLSNKALEHRAVAAASLVLAISWYFLLRSYRLLNGAKFKVIGDLEQRLPAKPFSDEWTELKKDPAHDTRNPLSKWKGRYAELGWVERIAPVTFAAVSIYVLVHG